MKARTKLNQLASTAICGNDISSSCLYVSALAIIYSGQYAWIALMIVGGVLYLFRKVYGEVVGAMPLNGGAYNALLNTTSKSMASLAATLTLLSYMATAVISANEAMHYAHNLIPVLPVLGATVLLLGIFMSLSIIGTGESSKVAIVIFLFHLISLIVLCSFSFNFLLGNGFEVFAQNNALPVKQGSIYTAIFFGFAAAMLGISGFESSANFVEEQQRGVFPKTLRNMWIVVTIFNPLLAFLALAILPMTVIEQNQEALLSTLGGTTGGAWLTILVSIDATLVLSGAVLTSFVGVNGLVERMALDRVLPNFLLKKNKKGISFRIAIVFFLLCTSILLITRGKLSALAGVYTIAFLSVMVLFGVGNILLKVRRKHLPRPEKSSWVGLLLAIVAVVIAIIGNAILNPAYLFVFLEYFIPTFLVVMFMLNRTLILKFILNIVKHLLGPVQNMLIATNKNILDSIDSINSQRFVFFMDNKDDIATLNKAMLYIQNNEHTKNIKMVATLEDGKGIDTRKVEDIDVLDREYPDIKIDLIQVEEELSPDLIHRLSKKWDIPINFMFIASPGDHFPYKIEQLGGVRLII